MIEITFQFDKLFQLQVNHDYYESQKWSDCVLVPDADTEYLMKKFNMLFRQEDGGFVILHDAAKRQALIQQLKVQDYELNFCLYSKNYNYVNYTDVPIDGVNKVAFFSTQDLSKVEEGKTMCLHTEDKVRESSFFDIYSGDFEVNSSEGKSCTLYNSQKEIIIDKKIESDVKNYIEASKLPSGKYFFEIDKKNTKTLILFKGGLANKPVSFINISLSGKIREILIEALEQGGQLPQFLFDINFSSRSTFWKYYVVPKYSKELASTVVKDMGKKTAFSVPELCDLQNGLQAYCYVSENPLPITQRPKEKFQLKKVNGKDSGGRNLIDLLPVASIDRIVPVKEGKNEKVYSEIIIYL